ncbi:hypothetical protein AYO22_09799 [Fonsecaea multimorphosa]|nr:hypothetical protein AYO22_09799 [Fonsecaea multimorphosa]
MAVTIVQKLELYLAITTILLAGSRCQPSSREHEFSGISKNGVPYSAYRHYDDRTSAVITVAVNVPSEPTEDADLYFHLEASNIQDWMAIGIGSSMRDSALTFVAYQDSKGLTMTVSPRLATSHVEPEREPVENVTVHVLDGSGVQGGVITADWKCANCRSWVGNSIDIKANRQPMIIAARSSGHPVYSDDMEEPISIHTTFGAFELDLVAATGIAGAPHPPKAAANDLPSKSDEPKVEKNHRLPSYSSGPAHGLLMLTAFAALYPLGIVWLRLLENVRLHALTNTTATILVLGSTGLGIRMSYSGNFMVSAPAVPSLDSKRIYLQTLVADISLLRRQTSSLHTSCSAFPLLLRFSLSAKERDRQADNVLNA